MKKRSLTAVRREAASCKRCPLYKRGTQTVFGEGAQSAKVVFVGEQPGDKEDLSGRPFVGPAGALLDEALERAGIEREDVYVTNAVKHFKWEPRGKRRIHKKPNASEISACRPWLDEELALIEPEVVVCLGATAAQSLLGRSFKVSQRRGEVIRSPLAHVKFVVATVHPSSVLRAPDDQARREARAAFFGDILKVAEVLRRYHLIGALPEDLHLPGSILDGRAHAGGELRP